MNRPCRPQRVALLAALTSVVVMAPYTAARAGSEPPTPATGHSQVVAQGAVAFGDGSFRWQLTPHPVTATPVVLDAADPTFIVSDGPAAVTVGGDTGPVARLAEGEALFRPAGAVTVLSATSPEGSDGAGISLVAAPDGGPDTFAPGNGTRDVDLVRDVLGANEALLLRADTSAFVVVTAGSVSVGGTPTTAGATVTLVGDITIINADAEPAAVLVAIVGPPLGASDAPAPTTTAPAGTAPPSPGQSTPTSPVTTAPRTTPTTPATTTTAPPVEETDTDSDGLSDLEESQLGTDPNDADSDDDGIPDGREVDALGSNPLDTDTDSDGLTDALEVDHSCGINDPDSDGDNLSDAFEANSGFSECSLADTDGDGDDDQAEFSIGTDPRDPNCFSGPGSVCG